MSFIDLLDYPPDPPPPPDSHTECHLEYTPNGHPESHLGCDSEYHPELQDQQDMVKVIHHTAMV